MTSSNFKSSICRSIKCVNHREQPSETDATYNGRDGKTNLRIMKRTINPTQLNKLRYRSRSIKNQQSIENHPDHQLLLQTSPNTDMMQSVRTQTPDYISESTRTNTSSRIITGPNPRQKTNILDQYEHSNKKEYLIDSNMIGNIANRSQQQQLRQLYCYGKIHKLSKHHISDSPNRKCGFNIIKSRSCLSMTASLPRNILIVVILHSLLSHLTLFNSPSPTVNYSPIPNLFARHTTVNAEIVPECVNEQDCENLDKTCYENKCICKRPRPIEDKERSMCLPHASLNEPCTLNEQCIGNSLCVEGFCSCGNESISVYNPSTKIYYCHPKRRLHEECNYDAQCPENAFCSTKKHGCLCQNGYGSTLVSGLNGLESVRCLPKTCRETSQCESEYHICEDNKCICLASHFDPHTAQCYKFGSKGGQLKDATSTDGNTTLLNDDGGDRGFTLIVNDLMRNSDRLWLIVIILAILTFIILAILILVLKKYYLGYCWTRTKEYEPNDGSEKGSQFNKNSINNKSFRKRSCELDGEDNCEDVAADRSSLVTESSKKLIHRDRNGTGNVNHYVKVDMNGTNADKDLNRSLVEHDRTVNGDRNRPLPSSTSTPV